jgi:thiamine-monophosphate kinase
MTRLSDAGEFEVIRRMLAAAPAGGPGVVLGPGDDAALLRPVPGEDLAVTTDAFVEGRHWRPGWIEGEALGARLAEANLSDLAAMAARPRWALLSGGLRGDHPLADLESFQRGLAGALAAHGAAVVGGNLTAVEGAEWWSLTLIGGVSEGRAFRRAGARPGDALVVSGRPGRAGAGLRLAIALGERAREEAFAPLLAAWRAPRARVSLALALAGTHAVGAAVDLSDGFAGDLAHLCEAGAVGAEVELERWPADEALTHAAGVLGVTAEALRMGPSDDYELLLAIAPAGLPACMEAAGREGLPLAVVGRFTDRPGALEALAPDGSRRPLGGAGWDHFAGR